MLKQDLIHQIMNYLLTEAKNKSYWINKGWIRWTTNDTVCALTPKTYSYLIDDGDEKKAKDTNRFVIKKELKFED